MSPPSTSCRRVHPAGSLGAPRVNSRHAEVEGAMGAPGAQGLARRVPRAPSHWVADRGLLIWARGRGPRSAVQPPVRHGSRTGAWAGPRPLPGTAAPDPSEPGVVRAECSIMRCREPLMFQEESEHIDGFPLLPSRRLPRRARETIHNWPAYLQCRVTGIGVGD